MREQEPTITSIEKLLAGQLFKFTQDGPVYSLGPNGFNGALWCEDQEGAKDEIKIDPGQTVLLITPKEAEEHKGHPCFVGEA